MGILDRKQTALVTGASSGIGACIARELATRVGTLVLVARRQDRLEQLRGDLAKLPGAAKVLIEPCDLADTTAIDALVARLVAASIQVDVLVNNAGVGYSGTAVSLDWTRIDAMLRVNITALTRLASLLVPGMVQRRSGAVLNTGSGAGRAFMAGAGVYSATKHYVRAFSETLRAAVAHRGVTVTELAPGPIPTELEMIADGRSFAYLPKWLVITPEQCAREAVQGLDAGKPVVYPGFAYRQLMRLYSFVPIVLERIVARKASRKLQSGR